VIGPESPQDHVTQKYTNTIVGRYANRIPVGTHTLERNGITSNFTAVANGKVQRYNPHFRDLFAMRQKTRAFPYMEDLQALIL
jgi:hypothetical protein